jgi:hypothetical protein
MPVEAEGGSAERHEHTAAILEAAKAIAGDVLHAAGFAVASPVTARFRMATSGTTGVEVTVELANPAQADRAAAVIAARFGEPGEPDALRVR